MKLFKARLIDSIPCFEYETHADASDLKVWIESNLHEQISTIDFKDNEVVFWVNCCYGRIIKQGTIVVFVDNDIKVYSKQDFELQYRKIESIKE